MGKHKDRGYTFVRGTEQDTRYWRPGAPLTEQDKEILAPMIALAEAIGRTPTRGDMRGIRKDRIKSRFRTWQNAILAAGLPNINAPEQKDAQAAAKQQEKGREEMRSSE